MMRPCRFFEGRDMRVYHFHHEQAVSRPIDEVFAFFDRAENLEALTPSTLGFRILTPSPIRMREGALIDYTLRIWGVPVHWRTLITHYDPPHRFVDEQIKGPYAFWHHTHTFTQLDGGVQIEDDVRYCMPFGLAGRFVHAAFVRRDLERIFRFRAARIAEHFS